MKPHSLFSIALWLVLAPPVFAQTLIRLPTEVRGQVGNFVVVPSETQGKEVRWKAIDQGLNVFPVHLLKDSKTCIVVAQAPGRYRLIAWTAQGDIPSEAAECLIVVGNPPDPGPTPPPGPDPPPPGPTPPPGPSPIPAPGFRVLILYESAELTKLTRDQLLVLKSQEVRDYLNTKCVKGPDGKTAEWRIWDKDVDASAEQTHWQAALRRDKKSFPWILIGTGTGGYEGPLPKNVSDTLSLLIKYGG